MSSQMLRLPSLFLHEVNEKNILFLVSDKEYRKSKGQDLSRTLCNLNVSAIIINVILLQQGNYWYILQPDE